jgi:anti-sigma factor RsiW
MKQCEEYELAISCYVDGEVLPVERMKMFGHLSECEACTGFLENAIQIRIEAAKETRNQFSVLKAGQVFSDKRLTTHLVPRQRVLALIRHRLSIPVPIAAVVMVLLLVLTLSVNRQPPESKQDATVRSTLPVQVTTLPVVRIP